MEKALATIKKYDMIQYGDGIVVGLSGGADSIALLYFLNSIKNMYDIKLCAVHINHGIRGEEAQSDAEFSENFCKSIGVDFILKKHDVPKEAYDMKLGSEEAGRIIRYFEFQNVMNDKGFNKIAVAHNLNDNAETVIMRLVRGSGMTGLMGIPPVRENIIRPLIQCSRSDIESYCKINGLSYKTDSTNNETDYTRNKIRLNIMPYICKEINSKAIEAIASASEIISEENNFIENIAKKQYYNISKMENGNIIIDREKFNLLDNVLKSRILRNVFNDIADLKDIGRGHIEAVINMSYKETGKKVSLPYSITAVNDYNNLRIEKKRVKYSDYCYNIILETPVYINEAGLWVLISFNEQKNKIKSSKIYTKRLDYDKIQCSLQIRNRRKGDRICIKRPDVMKKIKDIFIDNKVPANKRDIIPMLSNGEEIIAIGGMRMSAKFAADDETKNVLYFYIWGEN